MTLRSLLVCGSCFGLALLSGACEDSGLMTDTIAPIEAPAAKPDTEFLVQAVRLGQIDRVREQLVRGADPNSPNREGLCALHAFFSGRNWQLDRQLFFLLIENGADPNGRARDGRTPLHLAAERGRVELLEALLKAGAQVSPVDDKGQTPLHRAAELDREGATAVLLVHGASVDASDKRGRTPLHLAAGQEAWEVGLLLLKSGADPLREDDWGERPIAWVAGRCAEALREGQESKALKAKPCEARADLRAATLHQAAGAGSTDVVARLLKLNTDGSIHYGFLPELGSPATALHAAAAAGHTAVVRLLLTHGLRPDSLDANGWTPLHRAAWRGQAGAVEALIDAGAQVDRPTRGGDTALDLAKRGGHEPVIFLLSTP